MLLSFSTSVCSSYKAGKTTHASMLVFCHQQATHLTMMSDVHLPPQISQCYRFTKQIFLYVD